MEINVVETAFYVLQYTRSPTETTLSQIRDAERDFEEHSRNYLALTSNQQEIMLGKKIISEYEHFKRLGREITLLSKRRSETLTEFHRGVQNIDILIDETLQLKFNKSGADALARLEAVLDMEINIHEASYAVQGFILQADPLLKLKIVDSQEDFKRYQQQFAGLNPTPEERSILNKIVSAFTETLAAGNKIINMSENLQVLITGHKSTSTTIDSLLDEELQLENKYQVQQALDDSSKSAQSMIIFLICSALAIFFILLRFGTRVSRELVSGISALHASAVASGKGEDVSPINPEKAGALREVATEFNNMADRRKKTELELRQNADRFERWKASNFIGVIQSSANGGISDANDALLNMVGYSKQDLKDGKLNWASITPEEYRSLDENAIEEAALKGFWSPFRKEYFHKDGHRVPVMIGGSVFKDSPDEYIVFIVDLTEQVAQLQKNNELIEQMERVNQELIKSSETALENEKELREVFDSMIDAVITIDEAGLILTFNRAAELQFGYKAREIAGQN